MLPKLYKRSTTGKIVEWSIEVKDGRYRTTSGYTDGAKTTNEWTQCHPKNVEKSNKTTSFEQAQKEAEAKHRKKKESGYFENIKDIDGKVHFKPMLATKWEDHKAKIKYPIFSQPKLDGIRCIVDASGMWTRSGKPIVAAPHIFKQLLPKLKDVPGVRFDGEMYCDKLANDFNKICSLVKRPKPNPAEIAQCELIMDYHIYDLPSSGYLGFGTRSSILKLMLSEIEAPSCVFVKTIELHSEEEVIAQHLKYVEEGYEGQILRTDDVYENKRSKFLMKHKSFMDEEFKILDVCEGVGNKSGMAGFMEFKTADGKPFTSNITGSWELMTKMLKDRKKLIGKMATVKYFNLTPAGKPRFPYVIGIRDYE